MVVLDGRCGGITMQRVMVRPISLCFKALVSG